MRVLNKLCVAVMMTFAAVAFTAQPAGANTVVTSFVPVNVRFVDSDTCPFDIHVHDFGTFRSADYYNNSGDRYKTLLTAGGGKFTLTQTAKGTTLTMQSQTYLFVVTYNADGSPETFTQDGPVFVFTIPGSGVVLLDAGRVVFDHDGNITFEAGPHQLLHGDVDAFCAAFG